VPDRDFISRHVRTPWRSAARLWVREGPTDLTIDKVRASLAKALRDGGLTVDRARLEAEQAGSHLTREEREHLVERLLIHQAVLAPVRGQRLAMQDAAQIDREERALVAALTPDVERYASAILEGRRPTVRRRPRPDTLRILESPVSMHFP
jgi:hypothetical protein